MPGIYQANGPSRTIGEPAHLHDFIEILHSPKSLETKKLIHLYQKHNLSARQIEEKTGLSKQAILSRLRQNGITKTPNKGRSKTNYQFNNPPYGFKVIDEQLIPNPREIKIVRIIVQLRDRDLLKWTAILRHLNEKKIKTRTGKTWNRIGIKRIHKRWSGKI